MPQNTPQKPPDKRPRAALVAVQLPGVTDEEHAASLAELGRLAKTLGLGRDRAPQPEALVAGRRRSHRRGQA